MKSNEMKGPAERRKGGPGRCPIVSITEQQRRTVREIRAFIAHKGYPPINLRLAEMLSITYASVHALVNQLVREGYLYREPPKLREFAVTREPLACYVAVLRGAGREDEMTVLVSVSIIERVAAGQPLFAEENIIGEVLVEGGTASRGHCFAFVVNSDSTTNADIHEVDRVVVRQHPMAGSEDIEVALVAENATVKGLYIREEKMELRPENPNYPPIPIGPREDLRILEKMVGVRRGVPQAPLPSIFARREIRGLNNAM